MVEDRDHMLRLADEMKCAGRKSNSHHDSFMFGFGGISKISKFSSGGEPNAKLMPSEQKYVNDIYGAFTCDQKYIVEH